MQAGSETMHTLMIDLSSCPSCSDLQLFIYEAPQPSDPALVLDLHFSASSEEKDHWTFNYLCAIVLVAGFVGWIAAVIAGVAAWKINKRKASYDVMM